MLPAAGSHIFSKARFSGYTKQKWRFAVSFLVSRPLFRFWLCLVAGCPSDSMIFQYSGARSANLKTREKKLAQGEETGPDQ